MKLWHITNVVQDKNYVVPADSQQKLVEKLSNMFNAPVSINNKTKEWSIDDSVKGHYYRINEVQLIDIIWDGVEIISPVLSTTTPTQ